MSRSRALRALAYASGAASLAVVLCAGACQGGGYSGGGYDYYDYDEPITVTDTVVIGPGRTTYRTHPGTTRVRTSRPKPTTSAPKTTARPTTTAKATRSR